MDVMDKLTGKNGFVDPEEKVIFVGTPKSAHVSYRTYFSDSR